MFWPFAIAVLGLPMMGLTRETQQAESMVAMMFVSSVGLLVLTSALQPPTLEYRLPFDPLIMLTAVIGGRAIIRGRRALRNGHGDTETLKEGHGITEARKAN